MGGMLGWDGGGVPVSRVWCPPLLHSGQVSTSRLQSLSDADTSRATSRHIPTLYNLTMSYQELGHLVIGRAFESIYVAEECFVFYYSSFLFTYLFAFEINDR